MLSAHSEHLTLKGIQLARGAPTLTHCMFADDTIIFLKADTCNCSTFVNILNAYCRASGQVVNLEKSNLFFSRNTPPERKEEIAHTLGVNEAVNPGSYLGLPIIWEGSKLKALAYVRDRVGKKVMGWQRKCLSFAGREVMIKAVINAIPIYSMSFFKFPTGTCKQLDRLVSKFFWGGSIDSSTIHWKAWTQLTKSKQEGGLGFKDFVGFNDALLAKTAWRITQFPEAMWAKILKSIYFPATSFMNAHKGHRASWCWDSILKGREFLRKQLHWQVGTGHYIEVWNDSWIPTNPDGRLRAQNTSRVNKDMLVAELINDGTWNLEPIRGVISQADADNIAKIHILNGCTTDTLIWKGSKNGDYSVKLAYRKDGHQADAKSLDKASTSFFLDAAVWKKIWSLKTIPRVRSFLWQILNKTLASNEALFKRKCSASPLCPICEQHMETLEHLFLLCSWSRRSWFLTPMGLQISDYAIRSIEEWIVDFLSSQTPNAEFVMLYVANHLWSIWKTRCKWIFEHLEPMLESAVKLTNELMSSLPLGLEPTAGGGGRKKEELQLRWLKPVVGSLKVNCDGAWCKSTQRGGGVLV